MDKFKKNTRGYRLISSLTSNNATPGTSLQDTTPVDASKRTQNKYIELHDELINEPEPAYLSSKDPMLETNDRKVLLDISSSVHVTNSTSENHENISTCTEVNDAFYNLIQMEDYESGSRYMDAVDLNMTMHNYEEIQHGHPQSSFHQDNANITDVYLPESAVNHSDNNHIISQVSQANLASNESLPRTIAETLCGDHNADTLHNTFEPIINENGTGRPKKGRKRKYPDQTREVRKKLCETNKKYISAKGKVVNCREFFDVHCNDGCREKVTVTDCKEEFLKFWELGYECKCLYISSNVKITAIKRKRNKSSNKRKNTRVYSLKNKVVCANMFINTLRYAEPGPFYSGNTSFCYIY